MPRSTDNAHKILVGPFSRKDDKSIDESTLISEYFGSIENGILIDVGAHHGYSAKPFLDKGWAVHCFEPDPNNRKILEDRLGKNENISIYPNAVSDRSGQVVSFYASEESSGISGLSPFTAGHKEICKVTTVTLEEIIESRAIEKVSFLKIDTEGFDLMVLKGFPWHSLMPDVIECEFEDYRSGPRIRDSSVSVNPEVI